MIQCGFTRSNALENDVTLKTLRLLVASSSCVALEAALRSLHLVELLKSRVRSLQSVTSDAQSGSVVSFSGMVMLSEQVEFYQWCLPVDGLGLYIDSFR